MVGSVMLQVIIKEVDALVKEFESSHEWKIIRLAPQKWALVLLRGYKLPIINPKKNYGRLAAIGSSLDYHIVLYHELNQLNALLTTYLPNIQTHYYVDKDGGSDREIALKAGLGFLGRNKLLINPKLGSAHNIGYMIFTISEGLDQEWLCQLNSLADLDEQNPTDNLCGTCTLCVQACPTQALTMDLQDPLDISRCRSAVNQKSGDLSTEEGLFIGDYLYGCDACQWCCPYNKEHIESARVIDHELYMDLYEILGMTNKEIKQKYGHRSFAYLGGGRLRRNAKHILDNQED